MRSPFSAFLQMFFNRNNNPYDQCDDDGNYDGTRCRNSVASSTVQQREKSNAAVNRIDRVVYVWVTLLTMVLTYNVYYTCQLWSLGNTHRIELNQIKQKVNTLDHRQHDVRRQQRPQQHQHGVYESANKQLTRTKRYDNDQSLHLDFRHEKSHVKIGRAFRWVDLPFHRSEDSQNPTAPSRKRRRHLEMSMVMDPPLDEHRQQTVEFYQGPDKKPIDKVNDDHDWRIPSLQIPLQALEDYCFAANKRCSRGDPGPPGKTGEKGEKGSRGLSGARGEIGLVGPPGPPGQKGEQGLDGRDGISGEPGLDGSPGRDGKPGADGHSGLNGAPGRDGVDGKIGQKGEPGNPGSPGPEGKRGKVGSPGADGQPGTQLLAWKHNGTLLIPPSIDDMSDKKQQIVVKEGETIQLMCVATGQPIPLITWRRDDKRPINVDGISHNLLNDSKLTIMQITRDNMGSYLCVATNGIPPAAIKEVDLFVTFPPLIKVPLSRQMIGARKGARVTLECYVEAHPEPFVKWIFGESKLIVPNGRHTMHEEVLDTRLSFNFSKHVTLNIHRVEAADYGMYKCEALNNRGRTFGVITLFESESKTDNDGSHEPSFVIFGEMPKVVEKKCDPCPECNQCKQEQHIYSVPVFVPFKNISWQLPKRNNDSKCYLSQIGKPVLNGDGNANIGCWMRDPKPIKLEDEHKYWLTRIESNQILQEFDSKENFLQNRATRNYTLTYPFSGNAHTIYKGKFYYEAGNSNTRLNIYNLASGVTTFLDLKMDEYSESGAAGTSNSNERISRRRPSSRASRHVRWHERFRRHRRESNMQPADDSTGSQLMKRLYSGQQNKMDISADENGVWIVYPNPNGAANNTIVAKLSDAAQVEFVRNLTIDYRLVGDTFIMCGVLYGVENMTQYTTHIAFAYDLYAKEELKHLRSIEFTNPFKATRYIGYNSRHHKLYTWDRGNILEYPLKIDPENVLSV